MEINKIINILLFFRGYKHEQLKGEVSSFKCSLFIRVLSKELEGKMRNAQCLIGGVCSVSSSLLQAGNSNHFTYFYAIPDQTFANFRGSKISDHDL